MPRADVHADVVVVGAGFGGLGVALTLAEAGARVVLLERLNYPGGCASTFARDGYRFEAGATLFSGFGAGQLMRGWIDRHGLEVTIDWPDPMIELRSAGLSLPIGRSREALLAAFCALPDAPVAGLRRFFARQERVARLLWALFDEPALLPPFSAKRFMQHVARSPSYLPLLALLGRPLAEVMRRDGVAGFEPLRIYLDALCQITVQASSAEAEALFALAAVDYPFRGTGHVRGGIGELAWALCGAVERLGSEVRMSSRARAIRRTDEGWQVETKRGTITAPVVVANLLPQALATLVEHEESLQLPAADPRQGWGAAMLYLGLNSASIARQDAHHLELIDDPQAAFAEGNHIFVSIGDAAETERAPAGQRTATVSTHMPLKTLLDLSGPDRAHYVAAVQARMRATLQRRAPVVGAAIAHELTASPRTFERFTGRPHGFVGGIPRRAGLSCYRQLGPVQAAPGLYLVGDTVFPGQSTLATAIGGVKTAELIMRRHRHEPHRQRMGLNPALQQG